MIKPYYEDAQAGIVIYHGDCREILPQLAPVDLVLTDPPYGIDYQSVRRVAWQRKPKVTGDKQFSLWLFDSLKPVSALMVCCRWDILPCLPPPKSFIVWDKKTHSMGNLEHEYGRQWEGIAFYPGDAHAFARKRPQDIIRVARVSPEKMLHPTSRSATVR